jgi:dTDP-4-amino-4,6-dideoxygalactose transaminase
MPPYETVPDIFKVDMNNVQAKLGFKQLKRIDKTNKQRMAHARLLNEELSGIPGLTIPLLRDDREYVAVHYALWTEKSKELQNYLTRNKIDAQDETAVNTTTLERFASYAQGEFPNAAKLQGNVIFLPTHPYLSKNDILYMAQKVKEFFNK